MAPAITDEANAMIPPDNRVQAHDTMTSSHFLAAVDRRIIVEAQSLAARWPTIGDVIGHIHSGNKKLARPNLTFELARTLDAPLEQILELAVSAELIHIGSLLHDDVIDEAETRRGKTAAHKEYGVGGAILTGDVLLARALQRLASLAPQVVGEAADTLSEVSAAALAELSLRHNLDFDRSTWFSIARGKTGRLLAYCAAGTGLLTEMPLAAARLREAGLHLGVLFQLVDDLLDFGPHEMTGKKQYADLEDGNPNFLVCLAIDRNADARRAIESYWSKSGSQEQALREIVTREVVDHVFALVEQERELAISQLDGLSFALSETVAGWADMIVTKCHQIRQVLRPN